MTIDKHQSGTLDKPLRPRRRSMAELTSALHSGAGVERPPSGQPTIARHSPAAAFDERPGTKPNRRKKRTINEQTRKLGRQFSRYEASNEYRAKAFELMTANVDATLEYAQQLVKVSSPTDFIKLTTNQARKHLELVMAHAIALGALSQSLTTTNAERITASLVRVFRRQVA
jgi:hypothetical protein